MSLPGGLYSAPSVPNRASPSRAAEVATSFFNFASSICTHIDLRHLTLDAPHSIYSNFQTSKRFPDLNTPMKTPALSCNPTRQAALLSPPVPQICYRIRGLPRTHPFPARLVQDSVNQAPGCPFGPLTAFSTSHSVRPSIAYIHQW